jgi:hypothetical protein
MYSTHVHVRTSDSHSIFSYDSGERINQDASVRLGDHVWIGRQAIIGKGASVGDDVVIGQGAIVSGALDSTSCYAGVPAKLVKENVTWDSPRASAIARISETYCHRPKQLAVDEFLVSDKPLLDCDFHEFDDARNACIPKKNYRWIEAFR